MLIQMGQAGPRPGRHTRIAATMTNRMGLAFALVSCQASRSTSPVTNIPARTACASVDSMNATADHRRTVTVQRWCRVLIDRLEGLAIMSRDVTGARVVDTSACERGLATSGAVIRDG